MSEEKRTPTEVIVTISVAGSGELPAGPEEVKPKGVKVQDKDISMEVKYDSGPPSTHQYADWPSAADKACLFALRADLDQFEILFKLHGEEHRVLANVPADYLKGARIGGVPMLQVERLLERRGFESNYSTLGVWVIHRPDPAEGYAKRGYFNAAQAIRLATGDPDLIDEAIGAFWGPHQQSSSYARYLTMRGERRGMASKKEKAEETAKKQITAKALDGTEVSISPKQEELLGQIKERSASGSPVGSDDERLDDPSSIAAMKLATGEHPVVLRGKFGTRWHYFAKQADLDKATKAAEAAAEAVKKAKPAKAEKSEDAAPAKTNTQAAKGKQPLKKPSEK